jgi:predicted ATP-binding protein involved in virulence
MRIEKIEIENFRGFKGKHEVSFHPNLNVFVGVNGAGKSSVLDLIGMFIYDLIQDEGFLFRLLKIQQDDINISSTTSMNNIIFNFENDLINEEFSTIDINLIREEDNNNSTMVIRPKKSIFKQDDIVKSRINIPVFRYFGINDLESNASRNQDFKNDFTYNQRNAYKEIYTQNRNFRGFIKWFITMENIENRDKIRQRNLNHEDPYIKPVRNAVEIFLKKIESLSYKNLRVENSSVGEEINSNELFDLCIDKNNTKFNLGQLSAGEQTLILMVADIAQRLSIANPTLKNCLDGKGIVLIDEIETHLHPEWQREVIPALTATFPNIQFFITTHSPQVLSNVKRKSIFVIDNFEFVQDIPETFGLDSNSILRDVFETETSPSHASVAFQEVFKLLEQKKIEEVKLKLIELEEKYTDNPTLKKAKTHLDFVTMKNGK